MEHYSVMLQETIDLLNVKENGIYIDGTLGRGGHSAAILKKLKDGHLYVFDLDQTAIEESKLRLGNDQRVTYIHSNYANMQEELSKRGVTEVDGIVLDLGVSSPQFDDPKRGFSYRYEARLDMRMDQNQELSAYEVINKYSFQDLCRILNKYGEEKFAKNIARGIEKAREIEPISTTFDLVDVIKKSLPMKVLSKKGHPAKKSFQAIRIEVNAELSSLEKVLEQIKDLLNVGGTAAIITFHSLEDRIVKDAFKKLSTVARVDKYVPLLPSEIETADFELVNRKIILALDNELQENNRSSSAKLRGIRKVK